MFDGVDSAVGCPNNLIQNGERRLKGSEFDQGFYCFCIHFFGAQNLLTTPSKTGEVEICGGYLA